MSDADGVEIAAKFRMWLRSDGIVHLVWSPGAVMELDDAVTAIEAMSRLTSGRPAPLLADAHEAGSQSRLARAEFVRRGDIATAVAILVLSPLSRMMGNFYLSVNKPTTLTRLFEDEDQAIEWLRGYVA
ncbi:MAG TPA: hypothetical protein VMV96_00320 [Acidimicrobiales bacterium]|nr:hypothetical protein [Acidimicrobiales bacterium]